MALRLTLSFVAALTAGSMQAKAEDVPSKVLASYGLVGTWSPACGQSASARNPRITYQPRPDGLVDIVRDFGVDGPSRATLLNASIDEGRRLHTTTYARFSELPTQMRERIKFSWVMPDVTTTTISILTADGGYAVFDQVMEILGGSSTMHAVDGGFIVDQRTREPGPKAPSLFRCSE